MALYRNLGIIGVFFIALLFIGSVNATTTIECIDSATLRINSSKEICINTDCDTINQTEIITCPYGCSSTELTCKPTPFNQNLYFVGIIMFFIIAIAVIWHLKR